MSLAPQIVARQRAIAREFDRAVKRAMALRFQMRRAHPRVGDLLAELHTRVEQLAFAFRHYCRLEREYARKSDLELTPTLLKRTAAIVDELPFYVEAFYYFGHRAMKIAKGVDGIGTIEATGIRDVRNRLIEHPESMNRNFGFGTMSGFRLKIFRAPGTKAPVDDGLYQNTEQFLAALHHKLDAAGIQTCLPPPRRWVR
jgi:hypothetical protein